MTQCETCWMKEGTCECDVLAFNTTEACGAEARFRNGMELDADESEEIGDYCLDGEGG